MIDRDVDILIVGGGLVGSTLLIALADAGFSTLLVESRPIIVEEQAELDGRNLALSPASVQILKMLNVWSLLQDHVTEINTIHVSDRGHFGTTHLVRDEQAPLGYVLPIQCLSHALNQMINQHHILSPAHLNTLDSASGIAVIQQANQTIRVQARLIIAADGTDSTVREICGLKAQRKDYAQHALVANIGLARAHQYQAYERFTPTGPIALLPLKGLRSSLVWAMSPEEAQQAINMSDTAFLKYLQQGFGYRLGRFMSTGKRIVYPLRQVLMPQQVEGRVVFIGNAAHTLHPVAGQGFNLGLRDVAMLAQCIVREGLGAEMLTTYQQSRQYDQTSIAHFTHGLIGLFSSQLPGMGLMRSGGMMMLDTIPPFKNMLNRYARGYAGTVPDLACGIALKE